MPSGQVFRYRYLTLGSSCRLMPGSSLRSVTRLHSGTSRFELSFHGKMMQDDSRFPLRPGTDWPVTARATQEKVEILLKSVRLPAIICFAEAITETFVNGHHFAAVLTGFSALLMASCDNNPLTVSTFPRTRIATLSTSPRGFCVHGQIHQVMRLAVVRAAGPARGSRER